jgi:hypothetical protein
MASKQHKKIMHPNKNNGNSSPPAGKFVLSKPKNIAKQIKSKQVK